MSSAFDWRAKAACRDKDPELFFPVGNTGAAYQQIEEAKAVCRTCKVIDACLKCARHQSGLRCLGRSERGRAPRA
ncbi:MAG: WhiB family transcriptional regulator [Bifidobacterium pseudocatenulatum]